MASVRVISDDGLTTVYVDTTEVDGEPYARGTCECGADVDDRGNFADVVAAAEVHVDQRR